MAQLARGEDSTQQFKADVRNAESLGQEMAAFSNGLGGTLLIGVGDDQTVAGLTDEDVHRVNQLVSNAATNNVRPPISPYTENIRTEDGTVVVLNVDEGLSKPYFDTKDESGSRKGADKRHVTAREELQRMFQRAGFIHGDEAVVRDTSLKDVDREHFAEFFENTYGESVDDQAQTLGTILENMNLMRDGQLNVTGALLFNRPNSNCRCLSSKRLRTRGPNPTRRPTWTAAISPENSQAFFSRRWVSECQPAAHSREQRREQRRLVRDSAHRPGRVVGQRV